MTETTTRRNEVVAAHIGRITACVIAACAVAHIPVVVGHAEAHPVMSILMTAISMACLTCLLHLWRAPTIWTWRMVQALAAAMLVVHLPMLLSGADSSDPGRVSTSSHDHAHTSGDATGAAGMHTVSGLAALQILIASVVIVRHNRQRAADPAVRRRTNPLKYDTIGHVVLAADGHSPVVVEDDEALRPTDLDVVVALEEHDGPG